MEKRKILTGFIVVGFIVTVVIWGFVGGCGTSHTSWKTIPEPVVEEQPSMPVVEGQEYIVEPGDTLWGISKKLGVSVSSIKEASKLSSDTISVGQRLVVPGGQIQEVKGVRPLSTPSPSKSGLVVYKVKKDDSLWRIAQIYGTTIERLCEINGLPKSARLTLGQEILVPSNE